MANDLEPSADDRSIETALPATPQKKGWPGLAWMVIVLLVGLVLRQHTISPPAEKTAGEVGIDVRLMELQARYLVGVKELVYGARQDVDKTLYEQAQSLDSGPLDRRLRFVVLAGELAGPAEACGQLRQLEAKLRAQGIAKTPEQAALLQTLQQLYQDYAAGQLGAPSVTKEQRQQLRRDLGWFGELALAPPGDPDTAARAAIINSAQRTLFTIVGFVLCLGLVGLLGFAGLVLFVIFLFGGKLERGLHIGLQYGGVYAETFAVWMALFLGLSLGAAQLPFAADARWLLTGLASLLSLSALFWPVLRGIPWAQVRWDIGLRPGKNPPLEPMIGVATYAMALPLLVVGLLVTVIIFMAEGAFQVHPGRADNFNPVHFPSHPVVEYMIGRNWWARFQVLLLASVIAPIVEETMFRGVLYRHLREASARCGFSLSVLLSATLVSFLFAVIHPQGWEATPPLMALAFTFCLVREWRGSLLPPMVAHGINNGLVLTFLLLAMGN